MAVTTTIPRPAHLSATTTTACPLCGAMGGAPVATQVVPALAPDADRTDWPVRAIAYHGCPDCGTMSQYPLPEPGELDRYYATVRMARHVPAAALAKQRVYDDRLELLRRVTGLRAGTCLEVGCGNGLLLQMIAERWDCARAGSNRHRRTTRIRRWPSRTARCRISRRRHLIGLRATTLSTAATCWNT